MPKLLHVQSSPNLVRSITRTLSDEFAAKWVNSHEHFTVERLDLAQNPLPHWGPEAISGFMAEP
jgi:FMN-dependent NADH-azoreductase